MTAPPIPQLYAEPQDLAVVEAGATFVHTIDAETCRTPAPQTRCPCGYYAVEWAMLRDREGRHDADQDHS